MCIGACVLMAAGGRLSGPPMGLPPDALGPQTGLRCSPCAGRPPSVRSLMEPQPGIMWTTSSAGPVGWLLPTRPTKVAPEDQRPAA